VSQSQREHRYLVNVSWRGNLGNGTANYRSYKRDHVISAGDKPEIAGSSDPGFLGDRSRYNPEELLVASLSACHMLWYLHLCAKAGIVVSDYEDEARGVMMETSDGGGRFTQVTLSPQVIINADADKELALQLHDRAHHLCFIANSVNFPVLCEPSIQLGGDSKW
jgi:organic hydroperoxide reductase OsmC/OhrA